MVFVQMRLWKIFPQEKYTSWYLSDNRGKYPCSLYIHDTQRTFCKFVLFCFTLGHTLNVKKKSWLLNESWCRTKVDSRKQNTGVIRFPFFICFLFFYVFTQTADLPLRFINGVWLYISFYDSFYWNNFASPHFYFTVQHSLYYVVIAVKVKTILIPSTHYTDLYNYFIQRFKPIFRRSNNSVMDEMHIIGKKILKKNKTQQIVILGEH